MSKRNPEQIIEVKRGIANLTFKRSALAEVKDTHDGMVINLREGIIINMTAPYMTIETKGRIKQSMDKLSMANHIVVDLANSEQPVSVKS